MASGQVPQSSFELYQSEDNLVGAESVNSLHVPAETMYVQVMTKWELLENGAKSRFGRNIQLLRTSESTDALYDFFEDLQFSILYHDAEPTETRHTKIDVYTKEYVNRSDKERDETVVHVSKPGSVTQESRYNFTAISGITLPFSENIGAQIIGLAAAGGSLGMGYFERKRDHKLNSNFNFEYRQEEKVSIPPNHKVKAKITTSTVKYEMRYTLEFKIRSSRHINVSYRTRFQQLFCGVCRNSNSVFAADILKDLPNFREENGWCFFNQAGILTWIGENCSVEKTEEPLYG